jgi:hypothetical protein
MASVTVSAYTVVEADTLEEAMRIAEKRVPVIGGPSSGEEETESWIIDDADGMPENIHVIE